MQPKLKGSMKWHDTFSTILVDIRNPVGVGLARAMNKACLVSSAFDL